MSDCAVFKERLKLFEFDSLAYLGYSVAGHLDAFALDGKRDAVFVKFRENALYELFALERRIELNLYLLAEISFEVPCRFERSVKPGAGDVERIGVAVAGVELVNMLGNCVMEFFAGIEVDSVFGFYEYRQFALLFV